MNNKILIDTLPKYLKPAAKFVAHQEGASGLSTTRFIQDVSTCLVPKATFARSGADLAENVFLETSEEGLIYFVPSLLGQKAARQVFSKNLSPKLKDKVATTGVELLEKSKTDKTVKAENKEVLPIKAAIALAATAIPLTEFSLNYIKNLVTLKIFKKSDFKNIASLENNKEDKKHQEKVARSAKRHIAGAAAVYSGLLGLASLLALKGKNSKFLQNVAEFIVAPGTKLFDKMPKVKNFVNKYFCIDFNNHNGKLVLSKGQLTTCVLVGGCGYFGASADRGKENLKETATRFPLVAFYVITGSELVERGFKALLKKMNKCKEVIGDNLQVAKFDNLPELAQKLSVKNNSSIEKEYQKLVKQKVMIFGLPYLFSIGVMGFFVAGMTNHFTKKRYLAAKENERKQNIASSTKVFKKFEICSK